MLTAAGVNPINRHNRICSLHFDEQCLTKWEKGIKLKKGSAPNPLVLATKDFKEPVKFVGVLNKNQNVMLCGPTDETMEGVTQVLKNNADIEVEELIQVFEENFVDQNLQEGINVACKEEVAFDTLFANFIKEGNSRTHNQYMNISKCLNFLKPCKNMKNTSMLAFQAFS